MTKTHEQYIDQLLEIDSNLVPLENYQRSSIKIAHECPKGHIVYVRPNSVLAGTGCSICAGNTRRTHDTYCEELASHGSLFRPIENLINSSTAIKHKCKNCGYVAKREPYEILNRNKDCPKCVSVILYYIKLGKYYKIGITRTTILDRFKNEPIAIQILFSKRYPAEDAIRLEQEILLRAKDFLSADEPLKYGGNSEIFNENVIDIVIAATR